MDKKVAEKLSVLMIQINSMLNDSVAYVRDTCKNEEFKTYRSAAGKLMGTLYLDIANKLWEEYPKLKPTQMDGPYEIDQSLFEPRFYKWNTDPTIEKDLEINLQRQHIISGLLKARRNASEIKYILKNKNNAKIMLIDKFGFSPQQAQSLMDIRKPIDEIDEESILKEQKDLRYIESDLKQKLHNKSNSADAKSRAAD